MLAPVFPQSGASTSVLHWGLGEGAPAMGVAGEITKKTMVSLDVYSGYIHLPPGYLLHSHGKIHPFFSSVNHVFLRAIYTMANC